MPYKAGTALPRETASKLGHLEVVGSELVCRLVDQFERPHTAAEVPTGLEWRPIEPGEPLPLVFAVDGSLQSVSSETRPKREVSFVKTALLRLDRVAASRVNQEAPHPLALRDIMRDAALYHATVLPLRNVRVPGLTNYDAVRRVVYDSLRDPSLDAQPYETLKWLAYEKWTSAHSSSPSFQCPLCDSNVPGLPHDLDTSACPECGGKLYLSDILGFHLEMSEDAAPETVASAYMMIHETLMLFTGVRHFWQRARSVLPKCLFMKDGPLTLRGQYSKLVIPIRHFLEHARGVGVDVHIVGQEKTGAFADHLLELSPYLGDMLYAVPSNKYIREHVQRAPERSEPYGSRTNYGNKLLARLGERQALALSVPVGEYRDTRGLEEFIGADRILATLPSLVSHMYENALFPIQLANGVASLSSYPSAQVLKVFAGLSTR